MDIEAGAAQDAMTAILKAFNKNVDDVEDVMNKLVVVGNNFPVSVSDLAEGMNNAGSMLAVAGNSLEESIALLTAANTTVQNISKASTGLRTIAARIRKMDTEDGEIVEESKYNEMIDALTRHNVKLVDANGEYRKTYDIIKDIAAVWKDMTTMQQAAVIEALAGTRQQNIFASLMTQFGEAEEAVKRMNNAGGELDEAYGIYLDSIQAHVNTLKAAYDELARDFTDSDLAKGVIDFLTKIIELLDKLVSSIGMVGAIITTIGLPVVLANIGNIASGIKSLVKAFIELRAAQAVAGPLTKGASGLATAIQFGPIIAGVIALAAALLYYKKACIDAFPTTKQLAKEFKDAKKEADDLQGKLDANNKRIDELNSIKGTSGWTVELANEKSALEAENEELQGQLDLLRDIEKYKKDALVTEKNRELGFFFQKGRTVEQDTNTFRGSKTVRSDEGLGGVLNAIDDYQDALEKLNELEERRRNHDWDNEVEANKLKHDIGEAENTVVEYRKNLEDFWTFLTESRETLFDSDDEDSVKNLALINELIDILAKPLGKSTKSVEGFRTNLLKLDSAIRNKLADGLELTEDEFKEFSRWLNACGYTVDEFEANLRDLSAQMHADEPSENNYVNNQITLWGTMTEEIGRARAALADYQEAMKEGNNDAAAKGMQEAWKVAMEEIESGRIDSRAVWAFANMVMSQEQLADLGYDARRVAEVIKSNFFREMFDDDNTDNGFSDEDNKKGYGQRFLKYLEDHQGELPGVKVWKDADGQIKYVIDDFTALAEALQKSDGLIDALLDDLDAYGGELLTDTKQNTDLVNSLLHYIDTIGNARDATKAFIEEAIKGDANVDNGTLYRILSSMHDQGILKLDPSEYLGIIQEVREGVAQLDQEEATIKPRADDTLLVEDIDKMLENAQKRFDEYPLKARVHVDNEELEKFKTEMSFSDLFTFDSYEEGIANLHDIFSQLVDDTGDVNKATAAFVSALQQANMSDEQINGILNAFRGMDENIGGTIPTVEEVNADVNILRDSLINVDNTDVKPDINVNTNPAYTAVKSLVDYLNSVSRHPFMVSMGINSYGDKVSRSDAYSNYKGLSGKGSSSRAQGGITGKAGPVLVNELGPELISDRGRAFIANKGEPGFVNLSKDAIVFTAEETKKISGSGRKGLIGRLLGFGTGAAATGKWTCNICGYAGNSQTDIKCKKCGSVRGATKTSTTSSKQKANQQAKVAYTSTTSGKLGKTTAGKTASTSSWICPNCGAENGSNRSYCLGCGRERYASSKTSSLVSKGLSIGATKTIKTPSGTKSVFQSVQSANYTDLFNFGDDGGAGGGGGGGGGAASESRSNPQKIDWIAVKLNRIQREISDLEKVAESGLKKLSTRLDAAKKEASKLNEEIDIAQRGYTRYMQEAESVGLRSDLAEKVRNGTIDINEYDDEELRQQIQEYQEWYEKALECASAVEELNQQIGELYKTNFDLVQADYSNQLGLIEHEMNMINADMSMAQAKGMLDSAAYYERLAAQETVSIGKMKSELSDLERYFSEAMSSGKIEEGSEQWYAMKNEINGVKEAIAEANVQLQGYQKTMREIKWSYFDYAQEQFGMLTQEASFLISLMSNDKLFKDNGQFNDTGYATLGMRAVNYDAYMAQADEYAKEMRRIQQELASDPYNKDLIERRNQLLQLQQQSIQAAEQEKDAVKSLVQEGIQLELESLKDLIDAYKDSLDSAKDLYEYQKKISEKTASIASIQKQLAAYQGDNSEETRAKVQKLSKDLEKAQTDLAETERDQTISDQKKLLDDVYNEYEELMNARLDNVDNLMREMIDATNANSGTIRDEIANVADKVGYTISGELSTAMGQYANYDRMFESVTSVTTVLNQIYDNVNAMARAAGAVKAYAKGGLIDYTGLAAVHGTPGNPELVLSAADTEKFLQAAQMMQTMQNLTPISARDISSLMSSGGGGTSIGDIIMNIDIDRVQDYNDFVTQLQADPKFEKLIDAMTMGRMLGGSKFAKSGVRF